VKQIFLSDRLKRLVDVFEPTGEAVRLTPRDVATMHELFQGLRVQALALENEISRRRWNDMARQDRETRAVVEALFDADTGKVVTLFPDRAPAFSDGRDEPKEWR